MDVKWREKMVLEVKLANYDFDLPLARVTSFRIGGPADLYVEPETSGKLREVIEYCFRNNIPWLFLGRGSNVLVKDKGVRGVVIRLGKGFSYTKVEEQQVKAGAATPLSVVAEVAAKHALTGLEFASGIPGSTGGAVFMNAGAYGGEMKQVVHRVEVYEPGGDIRTLDREALGFAYRSSVLQQGRQIVLEVLMELAVGKEEAIREKMADYNQKRRQKQPLEFPSAGSVFKRPEGYYAGALIQEAGLKGARIGDARVSDKHAGFIINTGKATAADVLALIELVQTQVSKKCGVRLEPELRIVGDD